jgi:hypothetical protein
MAGTRKAKRDHEARARAMRKAAGAAIAGYSSVTREDLRRLGALLDLSRDWRASPACEHFPSRVLLAGCGRALDPPEVDLIFEALALARRAWDVGLLEAHRLAAPAPAEKK